MGGGGSKKKKEEEPTGVVPAAGEDKTTYRYDRALPHEAAVSTLSRPSHRVEEGIIYPQTPLHRTQWSRMANPTADSCGLTSIC